MLRAIINYILIGFQEVPGKQSKDSEPIPVEQPIAGPSNNASLPEVLRSATPPATPNGIPFDYKYYIKV